MYQERSEAFEYRKKFYPGAGPTAEQAGVSNPEQAFACVFSGGYGGGAPPMGGGQMGGGSGMYGGGSAPTQMGSNMPNASYNQGFGSNDANMGNGGGFAGGPGLGSGAEKVYSPYGG